MKKRQKPTVLIALLVLFATVALGINASQLGLLNFQPNRGATSAPQDSQTTAETVTERTKSALATKTSPAPDTKATPAMEAKAKAAAEVRRSSGAPLMQVRNDAAKPKPNDSSTSTQWYRKGTYTDEQAQNP